MKRILFVSGDLSGDAHAAKVAEKIKSKSSGIEILAFGGPALQKAADQYLFDLVGQSVVGFWEPLKKLPRFWHILNRMVKPVLRGMHPDVVVPVDFFGFNRFVAQAAKNNGSQVLYFISPQVWASRPGRIGVLKKIIDKMLVIFPFEESLYKSHGVPVRFVGHPLLDNLPDPAPSDLSSHQPVIGLLPGSRRNEVRRHLPLFLRTARLLYDKINHLKFVLLAAPSLTDKFYHDILDQHAHGIPLDVWREADGTKRAQMDLALTCSGTATLENALLGVPMAVVYKMSWLTYFLAKVLVRVKYISMVNILAEKELAPEYIQANATPENLMSFVLTHLNDPSKTRHLQKELLLLREKLGGSGASERAAEEILQSLGKEQRA